MQQQASSNKKPRIALDLLGSDADSNFILESAIPIISSFKENASFLIIAEEKNKSLLNSIANISYIIATDTITMEENPLTAIRKKKNSSLVLGIQALEEKKVDAFISFGSTGALVAGAKIILETLPHIKYPALLTEFTSNQKQTAILDIGAVTSCDSNCLINFAFMGTAYQKTRGIQDPIVGLLNIGKESHKGPLEFQEAYNTLSSLNKTSDLPFFYGNIEGTDAFKGLVDVIVTTGFAGNIFLKTAEGLSAFFWDKLSEEQKKLHPQFNPKQYPGAILCGVKGIVIKCHGNGNPQSIHKSISDAIKLTKENFIENIEKEINSLFEKILPKSC